MPPEARTVLRAAILAAVGVAHSFHLLSPPAIPTAETAGRRAVSSFAASSFSSRSALFRRNSAAPASAAASAATPTSLSMSSSSTEAAAPPSTLPTWSDLQSLSASTAVGSSLNAESTLRPTGHAAPYVQNQLRLFDSPTYTASNPPKLTLYRDHAGWCPYCQKTMLLIEEKGVPINVELVPMRSYGDKPPEFLRKVPSGLLPALGVRKDDGGREQIITESSVIMELLDAWHPPSEGYRPMLPDKDDAEGNARYDELARLERDLFSWWCTLIFRPEGPRLGGGGGGGGGLMGMLGGGNKGNNSGEQKMSGAMQGFLDCLTKVDDALTSTSGPWFFGDDKYDHPTMIDFVYVSHLERMLASCAFWKGLDLRSDEWAAKFPGINAWFDAFEKRECYLAFKSDYYTHVMDIPPQYGPGYDGGFSTKREEYAASIRGRDGKSWTLPLPFDDPLQPLYRGPPLPLRVLEAAGITPDDGGEGTYEKADPEKMAAACRHMAGWKLAENGINVARFAARGGPKGATNPRKTFGAELADPYAEPDVAVQPYVDAALRAVCRALLAEGGSTGHEAALRTMEEELRSVVPSSGGGVGRAVANSLCYLRDRVGVPRDLPLAAARHLRAHLNAAIDAIGE